MNQKVFTSRLVSLDIFRGLTIAGMLLVNNPGSWSHIYAPLKHAEWHGWTPTDLIFPFFLFIVGVSIKYSLDKYILAEMQFKKMFLHILRRSIMTFVLGLLLHSFIKGSILFYILLCGTVLAEHLLNKRGATNIILWCLRIISIALVVFIIYSSPWETLRIPGVLQRIAICYFISSYIYLYLAKKDGDRINFSPNKLVWITSILLIVYYLLMQFVPVPGFGAGVLGPNPKDGNLGAYIDRLVFTEKHLWKTTKTWDPEGLLSSVPAIGTTLIGIICAWWLKKDEEPYKKVTMMFVVGTILFFAGYILDVIMPINKALWTSSYVILTAGLALNVLGVCYWYSDIKGYSRGTTPFLILGTNAITVFFCSGIFARILGFIQIGKLSLKDFIYKSILVPVTGNHYKISSLIFAVLFVLLWVGLTNILYRKKLFIKI